ncbi:MULTISPECIES: PepSY domain-containing protein [Paracoccus]|uniref:PepSY domain-containing protein n=1 Tax=Paracoccus TaxID=265 RepID=UPI000FD79E74|nr:MULTISPECIES: PepSY domain-containing protein [Paracoccus]AZY94317.1 peptidase [Paracoccus sp. Arc7-R13]TNC04747.1 peptidase [Paracoccus marcusii]
MKRSLSSLMLILLPLTLAAQPIAPDYETARQAVDRGDMLPLEQILARIEALHPGRIVEVELEDEDGLWLYEIEVLTPEGRLIEIELDARTGAILVYEEDDD